MDELCNALIRLFRDVSAESILSKQVKYNDLNNELLEDLYYASDLNSDEAENHRRVQYLWDQVELELHEEEGRELSVRKGGRGSGEKDVPDLFDLIVLFARLVLVNRHEEAVCRFQYLQTWRDVTNKIDSAVFVAAKYADIDYKHGKIRNTFTWKTMTGHNNVQLNRILDKGISDNHFHLHASAHYFDLSWLTLMNQVNDPVVEERVSRLSQSPRTILASHKYNMEPRDFSSLQLKAALIRVYLYGELTELLVWLEEFKASWRWLLGYLFGQEGVMHFLSSYHLMHGHSSDESRECFSEELQRNCPGFYWLFEKKLRERGWKWNHLFEPSDAEPWGAECNGNSFSDLLCLWQYYQEFSLESCLSALNGYEELPLEECAWIFKRGDISFFTKEWNRQCRRSLENLLNSSTISHKKAELQCLINSFLYTGGQKNKDYAMEAAGSWYISNQSDAVMVGERWLLYQMFRRRYGGMKRLSSWHYSIFYAYLVMKESFRMELLQSNDREGFLNFHEYQRRKSWFTPKYSAGELAKVAVDASFKYQNIISLEIRIKPGNTCSEDERLIQMYDRSIGWPYDRNLAHGMDGYAGWEPGVFGNGMGNDMDSREKPYYYVFHFAKRPDDTVEVNADFGHMFYRHYKLREEVRRQAEALILLRKRNPEIARRVRGIDACSNEDGCRPEVFATAYRVLRNHSCYQGLSQKLELPQLRMTYHVGEVFQDILDGLRAIYEAIRFLNMDCGDRLGHCTVLGLDPREWYRQSNYMVSIRYQDYLDNVMWLYHMLIHYHISGMEPLLEYLQREFQLYFSQIYGKALETGYIERAFQEACACDERYGKVQKGETIPFEVNINLYYYSWMLRGDHPGLYADGFYKREINVKTLWEDYCINHSYPREKRIRYIFPAVILNHFYHYNKGVKILGDRMVKITIPDNMVDGICAVQKELQKDIANREIGIETNPSSNVMISRLQSYDEHPIVHFFNKCLTNNSQELGDCAQLNVSINTDDQGVFSTELSNEYALMVSALGSIKDDNGNYVYKKSDIYDWIQRIQEMGNNQSFRT